MEMMDSLKKICFENNGIKDRGVIALAKALEENDTLLSPYFNSEKEATDWLEEQKNKLTDPVKDY